MNNVPPYEPSTKKEMCKVKRHLSMENFKATKSKIILSGNEI